MRLIDADALVIDYYDDYETKDDIYTYAYVSEVQIDSAPSIDIVRCRDCKYWDDTQIDDIYCSLLEGLCDISGDSFCSYGERREP